MAKPTIGDILSAVPDPMLSDNYTVTFPRIPVGFDSRPLTLQCQSATKPGTTINAVEVQLFGHTAEYAGNNTTSHSLPITYVENDMGIIHATLEEWTEFCRSKRTQLGAKKKQYAVDAVFTIYDVSGAVAREYKLINTWPSVLPDTNFDGTGANLITVAAEFKFDYFIKTRGS